MKWNNVLIGKYVTLVADMSLGESEYYDIKMADFSGHVVRYLQSIGCVAWEIESELREGDNFMDNQNHDEEDEAGAHLDWEDALNQSEWVFKWGVIPSMEIEKMFGEVHHDKWHNGATFRFWIDEPFGECWMKISRDGQMRRIYVEF